jgi:hypothetical protein
LGIELDYVDAVCPGDRPTVYASQLLRGGYLELDPRTDSTTWHRVTPGLNLQMVARRDGNIVAITTGKLVVFDPVSDRVLEGHPAGIVPRGVDVCALDDALDEILKDAESLIGLVIDVRINHGGADPYGVQIAGRLTDKPYVAFVKRARNDAQNPESWTASQSSTVRVSSRPRFLKGVVELIGPDTVSAGETFTMALMGRQPRITRIGDNTQGVYSDVLVRSLPNGWRFGLPNEVFLTEQGQHFEASGVPPDLHMPVFPKEDLAAGRDSALEKALETLAGKSPTNFSLSTSARSRR